MYNRVILMGRLTKDPELKTTQSGISMCRFDIAVDRRYSKQGEEKQTDFFQVTTFRQTAEFVCKYFSKGRMIHVEGALQNNHYTDNNGVKHYGTAIMADNVAFCGDKSGSQQSYQNQGCQQSNSGYQQQGQPAQQVYGQSPQGNYAHRPIELGDLGEFEEILSDGDVPF